GHLGILAGADDFGGILIEENVLKTSGYIKQTSLDRVKSIIRDCQFTPALRDSFYNVIEIYNNDKT
ncbi:MAG: dehypoxanthine futalosine cyclase, partial [Chitinispirillia bacterium]